MRTLIVSLVVMAWVFGPFASGEAARPGSMAGAGGEVRTTTAKAGAHRAPKKPSVKKAGHKTGGQKPAVHKAKGSARRAPARPAASQPQA